MSTAVDPPELLAQLGKDPMYLTRAKLFALRGGEEGRHWMAGFEVAVTLTPIAR